MQMASLSLETWWISAGVKGADPTTSSGTLLTVLKRGRKLSYVGAFEPWGWVVGTGVDRADAMAAYMPMAYQVGIIFGAIGFFAQFIFWLAIRNLIGKPLSSLAKTSEALALGDVEQKIERQVE